MDSPSFEGHLESGNSGGPTNNSRPWASAWLAWAAIIVVFAVAIMPHDRAGVKSDDDSSITLLEIQAKYLVGASSLSAESGPQIQAQITQIFDKGPLRHRLIGVALVSDLIGATDAEKKIDELEGKITSGTINAGDREKHLASVFRSLLQARIAKDDLEKTLPETDSSDDRQLFVEQLGWVGKLVWLPPETSNVEARTTLINQARKTLFIVLGVFMLGVMAAACGALLQVVWWSYLVTGQLNSGIKNLRGNHLIYAETFAVWLGSMLAISLLLIWMPRVGFVMVLIPQIGSLAALAWPVLRGLRWSDVREDVGLWLGPQGWAAPFVGLGTYLSALPVLAVAIGVTFLMMFIAKTYFGASESIAPTVHPIVEPLLRGSWAVKLQLVIVAVFAAVPEEIMFRGFLYRHLREVGKKFGYVFGVTFATVISSFLFAVIHPQGVFGIPILMSLAMVFALVREWRGSLVPCMIAHAFVNAGTSSLLLLISD